MSYTITRTTYVDLAEIPLATPAWECLNPGELLKAPPARGKNRVIPEAEGQRPMGREVDEAKRLLQVLIKGTHRWDGVKYTNPLGGLIENIDHLRDNVTDPFDNPSGRIAVVHYPNSAGTIVTKTGDIIVESFEWDYWDSDALAVIECTIPGGYLS